MDPPYPTWELTLCSDVIGDERQCMICVLRAYSFVKKIDGRTIGSMINNAKKVMGQLLKVICDVICENRPLPAKSDFDICALKV